ncbi:MAG: ABC transporter permease subunit, partial [Fusobacterium sp.]|nr:ABC transporter permease subunit [Fusobacterium sp.]
RLKGLVAGMMRIEAEDKKIVLFKMFETIITAFASSFIGVLLAVLCSPFLATNISNKYLARFLTVCFSIFRTVPALVMAAILVSLIGIGSFTGFISLLIITFFSATKLLKEYLEEINPAKIQSFRSFGFSKFTFLRSCIYPFSKPYIISLFFLTLESSIRGASVLGMVGAGGIGEELWKNLSFLRYDKVSFIIVILLGFIFLTDTLSWFFRKKDNLIKITTSKGYKKSKFISNFVIIGVLILLVFSLNILYEDTNKISAPIFFERLFTFLKKFRNLDFTYSGKALLALWQSFLVAFFATVFAAPSAIIVSYFANSVTSNKIIAFLIKIFINFIRTFPPVIVAILFFSGFGPGLISGFFALY